MLDKTTKWQSSTPRHPPRKKSFLVLFWIGRSSNLFCVGRKNLNSFFVWVGRSLFNWVHVRSVSWLNCLDVGSLHWIIVHLYLISYISLLTPYMIDVFLQYNYLLLSTFICLLLILTLNSLVVVASVLLHYILNTRIPKP